MNVAPRNVRTRSAPRLGPTTLVRGVDVVADRRADTGDLACGHCRADAGAADEDAALRAAVEQRLADLARLVGVVDPHRVRVRAEVDDLVPAAAQRLEHHVAQVHSAVIECHRDVHQLATRSRSASARATTLSAV